MHSVPFPSPSPALFFSSERERAKESIKVRMITINQHEVKFFNIGIKPKIMLFPLVILVYKHTQTHIKNDEPVFHYSMKWVREVPLKK